MRSSHLNFTKAALAALPAPAKTTEYYDTKQRGLSLRVHPTGKKTFCHVFRLPNKRTLIRQKLGYSPDTPIAEVRDRVRDAAPLVRKGIDPRLTKAAVSASVTLFEDLARRYIELHVPRKKAQSGKNDVYWINKELLPAWRKIPVGEIKRRHVATLLTAIAKRGTRSSDIVRSLISRMFRLGISVGFDEIESNPALGTERVYMKAPRDKMPTTDELSRLWAIWDRWIAEGRSLLGWQFQLRVLTAQRGAEILNMRWSTLDGDHWLKPFEIRKRRKYTARPTDYLIVLGPMALSILRKIRVHHEAELARMNDAYSARPGWPRTLSDRVFPGRRDPSKGATNFWGEEVAEMIRDAKLTDFRPHDLRRWASTNAQSVCQPDWVERYLDHEIQGVGGVYNLYDYEAEKRYVACAIENKVREALAMPPIEMPPVAMPGVRRG